MDIDAAKSNAENARSRLNRTAMALRDRLTPKAIASDMLRVAKKRGRVVLLDAATSKKTRPLLAVGMITAGAAYLLRKPIFTAIAKRLPKETQDD